MTTRPKRQLRRKKKTSHGRKGHDGFDDEAKRFTIYLPESLLEKFEIKKRQLSRELGLPMSRSYAMSLLLVRALRCRDSR